MGLQTFVAGAMIAQLIAGMATRDALFLERVGPAALPYVMAASAVLSLIVVSWFGRLLVRWSPDRVVPAAFALNASLFIGEWLAGFWWPYGVAVLTYLHTMVLGAVLVSGFWTLMTEHFDPHTAKRVFGTIGAGASIGGILGGLAAAGAGGRLDDVTDLLPCLAALNIACVLGLRVMKRPETAPALDQPVDPAVPTGFTMPYLRHLAVFVVITAIADATLDYVFKASAKGEHIQFFALFYALAGAISFLLQVLVTRPLLQNVGIAGTLVAQPIVSACGTVLALFVPGLIPIVRAGDTALRTSLFKASYELLYTPLQPAHKRRVKTKIDVGFSRTGGFTGSVLVFVAVQLAASSASSILLLVAAIACAVAITLVAVLHRGYVNALADSLTHHAIRLDPADVEDATTRKTLAATTMGLDHEVLRKQMAALQSGEIARMRSVIAGDIDPALVAFTLPLLARDDLAEETTRALRKIAPSITGHLVDTLLDPKQPRLVRRRIPRVLIGSVTQRAVDGLVLGLKTDSFDIRNRCALALERLSDLGPTLVIERTPVLTAVLAEAAQLGDSHERARLDQIFVLLGLVLDRRPLKLAYRALASGDMALRGTGLEYLENVLPPEIRDALKDRLGPPAPRPAARSVEVMAKVLLESMPAVDVNAVSLDEEPV